MEREREAQHGGRADLGGGPARDARTRRPPAGHDRQPAESVVAQLRDHGDPGRVELVRRRGAPPPGHAVRLLDERHAHPGRPRGARGPDEVRRLDPAAGPVAEHDPGHGRVDRVQMDPRETVRSVELEDPPSLAA